MATLELANANHPVLEDEQLTILDNLTWDSVWNCIQTLDAKLDKVEPQKRPMSKLDNRNTIAVQVLDLSMDWDEEWIIYRMKQWVNHLEAQFRDIFPDRR